MGENKITLQIIMKLQSLTSERYFWFPIFLVNCNIFHLLSFEIFSIFCQFWSYMKTIWMCTICMNIYLHHNSSLYSRIGKYMYILQGGTHMFQTHKVYSNNSPQLKLNKLIRNREKAGCMCYFSFDNAITSIIWNIHIP